MRPHAAPRQAGFPLTIDDVPNDLGMSPCELPWLNWTAVVNGSTAAAPTAWTGGMGARGA
eukprot:CAMPEP_0113691386 /NCGR_PEP_ID=MMETSP0038_2-20120614/18398_1 /TAXON_ID=2898 /ORGANISM="Cryptomonas paramecium" /LENGTH=59 /DNA_ID=CAMNT_0000612977 /DNA_START=313 /DNA_END=489 /DNA_ORIENTATION=- /assembly_acc=CAM_ASM_000170